MLASSSSLTSSTWNGAFGRRKPSLNSPGASRATASKVASRPCSTPLPVVPRTKAVPIQSATSASDIVVLSAHWDPRTVSSRPPSAVMSVVVTPMCRSAAPHSCCTKPGAAADICACSSDIEQLLSITINRSTEPTT